jgi:hypothetical protein
MSKTSPNEKPKRRHRILGFFRSLVAGGVETSIATDTVRAKVGSHSAKDRLGVVRPQGTPATGGPVVFTARCGGRRGHVYLATRATVPAVGFSTDGAAAAKREGEKEAGDLDKKVHAEWSVAVADIAELRKVGGYGWKFRIIVGWSLEREVADGLEIVLKTGEKYKVTAMPQRDELFNRLVAMGGQKWVAL